MDIGEQKHGAVTVLRPVGPLVKIDVPEFSGRVDAAISASLGRVVLDATGVPFVDSAGLEAVFDAAERLTEMGQSLRVCGASDALREALVLTEIAPLIEFYEDLNTATRSFL